MRAVGAEPVSGPVERAEKCTGGDGGIGTAASFTGDERPNAALVAIALRDNPLA